MPSNGKAVSWLQQIQPFSSHHQRGVREVVSTTYDDSLTDEYFLGSINCPDEADPWEITLKLNNTAVKFKIDTGADITVISESTYLAFPSRPQH